MGNKFYIERWVDGQWVRIAGATATKLQDAEALKLGLAKAFREDVRNLSIVCEVGE
jgi:hypothetical protein